MSGAQTGPPPGGLREWVARNKLRAVGLFWAGTVGGSLAYQWTRPIPNSLKIIHARVYAQAFTLTALALAGIVDVYEHRQASNEKLDDYHRRLREVEAQLTSPDKEVSKAAHAKLARLEAEPH